jgi:hypothetical protein
MSKPFPHRSSDVLGTGFGPVKEHFDDLMHSKVMGLHLEDASEVQLRDILAPRVGASAFYAYDLRDFFAHTIELEEVSDDIGSVTVIGGANACPPENSGGNRAYANMLLILEDRNHRKYAETLATCNHAQNCANRNFKPFYFDVEGAQRQLERADVASQCNCPLCRRCTGRGAVPQKDMGSIPFLAAGGGEIDPVARQQGNLMNGNMEYHGRKEGIACCSYCLDRECPNSARFQQCSRCKQQFYCSRECQMADWKQRHKKVCVSVDK